MQSKTQATPLLCCCLCCAVVATARDWLQVVGLHSTLTLQTAGPGVIFSQTSAGSIARHRHAPGRVAAPTCLARILARAARWCSHHRLHWAAVLPPDNRRVRGLVCGRQLVLHAADHLYQTHTAAVAGLWPLLLMLAVGLRHMHGHAVAAWLPQHKWYTFLVLSEGEWVLCRRPPHTQSPETGATARAAAAAADGLWARTHRA